MIRLTSADELLGKAFHLACFILNDRDAALRVVTSALAKLQVATAAQSKRLYYRPTGRIWSRHSQSSPFRNNISFNQPHLLQRLIYIESEPYEIAQEQAKDPAAVGKEDLVIHFIKHLTKKTVKRNSFYVTLGMSRLLYSYTTAETMDIYNAVIQDPARVKDDYYCRSRKGVLMEELKQRFGDLINICRGPRGEERFQADDNPGRFVELVRESLNFFTPWHTPCLVPSGIDPITDGIPSFSYQGNNEEDKIEVSRVHAVLHPDCFQRLTTDLRLDIPDSRLEIPRFFYANDMNDNGSNSNRRNSPKLNEQELVAIKDELERNAARRKVAHSGLLRIMVDGNEGAQIDLANVRRARFGLDEDAELIEVRSRDNTGDELLLATHFLAPAEHEDGAQPADASITLEGGQKISIVVLRAPNMNGASVDVHYRETNPFRAAALRFHQLEQLLSRASSQTRSHYRIFATALALFLLAISFGVALKYLRRENGRTTVQDQHSGLNNAEKTASTSRATDNTARASSGEKKTSKSLPTASRKDSEESQRTVIGGSSRVESAARNSTQETPGNPPGGTIAAGETRSMAAERASTPLSAVKKVYFEAHGDQTLSYSIRQMLNERLQASNRIIVTENRNDADALLKLTIQTTGSDQSETKILVELINAKGDVIWPKSGGNYQGSPAGVSARIVRDLIAAIQKSKQQ